MISTVIEVFNHNILLSINLINYTLYKTTFLLQQIQIKGIEIDQV